jgi:hypothetical protein
MGLIDERCPVCGGYIERVDVLPTGLKFDGVIPHVTTMYKCLSEPSIGHMPANWHPAAPPWDQ